VPSPSCEDGDGFQEEILQERAERASRDKYVGVLAKVPDVAPQETDQLPAGYRRRARRRSAAAKPRS
jgi:hypothetical protein